MCQFSLEFFYEEDEDREFTEAEAAKFETLVQLLAAADVTVQTSVHKATAPYRSKFTDKTGTPRDVPNHAPTDGTSQTLLITNEEIDAQGWAGPGAGCVSKSRMEKKECNGGNSADITIHEWLHTISGQPFHGRTLHHPHDNAIHGFPNGTKGPDGEDQWYDWYTFILR